MDGQPVIGRAEGRVPRKPAVLRFVDSLLQMLDTRADRERLRLHRQSPARQKRECVAGAVADGENHAPRFQRLRGAAPRRAEFHARQVPVPDFQVRHPRVEQNCAAERLDSAPQVAHDAGQQVGADMRLCEVQDFRRGAGLREFLQHLADAGVLRARVQLSVGESARAPFAELDVALRVELRRPAEPLDLLLPLFHGGAALQHHRALPRLRQNQGGEHPRGAEAHHDRARAERPARGQAVPVRLRFGDAPAARRGACRAVRLYGADKMDVAFPARVHGFFVKLQRADVPRFYREPLCRRPLQIGFRSVQRKPDAGNAVHESFPLRYSAQSDRAAARPAAYPLAQAQCRL